MNELLDCQMKQAVENGVFPGGILLVSLGGRILFHKGFGVADINSAEKISPSTCFDLASLTKPLATALSIMKLVGDNLLSLDMMLCDIITEFKGTDKAKITLNQLLRHTSGLPAHRPFYKYLVAGDYGNRFPNGHRENLRRLIVKEPVICKTGEKQIYSDIGYMILCWVIESITHTPFDIYVENDLYSPMGIRDLFFVNLPRVKCSDECLRNESEITSSNSPSPFMERGLGGEVNGHVISDLFLNECPDKFSDDNSRLYSQSFHFASTEICPWRKKTVHGEVHDDNAWVAGGVEGHAGLFGTAFAVWQVLGKLMEDLKQSFVKDSVPNLFFSGKRNGYMVAGFDTPSVSGSSSGKYFSRASVGHLGFTGTSFWMDPVKDLIVILLTNRVHPHRNNEKIKQFRPQIHDLILESLGLADSIH